MNIFKKSNKMEIKANPIGATMFFDTKYVQKDRKTKDYVTEGYLENVIVYRCIREIVTALSSITLEVHNKQGPIENHPALDLLKKPNSSQGWGQFIKNIFSDYLITGNMYILREPNAKKPTELWAANPLYMTPNAGRFGIPASYTYQRTGIKKQFPVDQLSGDCQVFHFKTYNPEEPFIGVSPLKHSALAADTHNDGLRWNNALLKNGARPSGIIKYKGNPSKEALSMLREFFKDTFQGAKNAGAVPILTEDGDWTSMSETPKDMDYLNTMREMAKYVASAYGVPLPLIDNDSSTFNNLEQAKERLWTDTVLPLLNEFLESFGPWLLQGYGKELSLKYDYDSIPALESLRAKRFVRMVDAANKGILTINEAREAMGYMPINGAGELLIPSSLIPLGLDSGVTDQTLKSYGLSDIEIKQLRDETNGKMV